MNYSYILCFMGIWFNTVSCAPVAHENPFYDAIVEKCPSVHSDTAYQNNPIFKACKDWKAISEVNKSTASNGKDIRCLFYFNSFTEYCTKAPKVNTTVPKSILLSYEEKIDMICDYAKSVSHKNLSTIFLNEDNCKKICSDDLGFVDSICGMSYYFAQSKVEPLPHLPQSSREISAQKTNATEQETKVPSPNNVQPNEHIHADETPQGNDASQMQNLAAATTKEKQSQHEQSLPNVNPPSIHVEAKNEQLDQTDSHINLPHNVNNAMNAAMPNMVDTPPQDGSNLPDNALDAHVHTDVAVGEERKSSQQGQVSSGTGKEISSVHTAVVNSVDEPVEPPTEKNPIESVHTPKDNVAKPADQNSEEDGKRADNPVVETDNQDIQQDLEDDKQTAQQQQIPNQDTDMDDDIQLPEGQDDDNLEPPVKPIIAKEKDSKPLQTDETDSSVYNTEMDGDSYFFTYFMMLCIIFIVGYVCYHNKQKILALILEGRKGRRQYRGRRPNSANYHKLDSNLEEAITSSCKKNTNNVIY